MESKPHQPEMKFGPYLRGIEVTLWRNTNDTKDGLKISRSMTISPPRYQDPKDGQWKDSKSFFESDARLLLKALTEALSYIEANPLPQAPHESSSVVEGHSMTEGRSRGSSITKSEHHTHHYGPGESETHRHSESETQQHSESQ